MRDASFLMILLLAGGHLSAQTIAPSEPASIGCPVHFGAEVSGRAVARSAKDAKKDDSAQLLELKFSPLSAHIVSATVIVHGLSQKGRFLPANSATHEDETQVFHLKEASGTPGLVHSDVWISKMTVIKWAELTELQYEDGSVWQPSKDSQCRSVPSGLRLVNATAQ